ncbi:MAG: YciI family protein, partial [Pyrinomonadaceae bacterium]
LRLAPRLLDEKNWTERERGAVARHFSQLQQLQKEGKLVLAGRTLRMDPKQMGFFIVEVETEEEAQRIMEADAAVKDGVMTAELFPFRVALER